MTLLELAEKVGEKCIARAYSLTAAESLTGGGLSYWLTAVPGCSQWFERSFVCYVDKAKEEMLGIKASTLRQHGAVSEACVREMAIGALKKSNAQISIAITGIAGPTGDTSQNPIGTVWFGFASHFFPTISVKYHLTGTRKEIREKTIEIALKEILKLL